jgi:hypothetical protein
MADLKAFTPIAGKEWDRPVLCPSCRVRANTNVTGHPRFSCPDARCHFRFGWRLQFGADFGRKGSDINVLFAIPLTEGGDLDYTRAVVWRAVEGMRTQDTDAAA